MAVTNDFAFELPDGFVEQLGEACSSYVHAADCRELTLASFMTRDDATIDEVLLRLAEQRLEVFRRNGAADHALPIEFTDHNDLRVASFLSVGRNPMISFCANVTSAREVAGGRHVAMFCAYQYFKPGAGAPNVDLFERFARMVAGTLRPISTRFAQAAGR